MVLARIPLFVSGVSFALVFPSSTFSALCSLLVPLTADTAAAAWTILLFLVVFVPVTAAYYTTWRYVAACRPCQLVHQAHVYCAYAFFAALLGVVVFAVAWARVIDSRVAFGAYGAMAPLSLMLFIASYTPFPALIHRLPSAPHYLVE